jgi:flagellar hook-associated protein 1 FlgK
MSGGNLSSYFGLNSLFTTDSQSTVTGSQSFASGDSVSGLGTITVTVTNPGGGILTDASGSQVGQVTVNLSSYTTVGDVASALTDLTYTDSSGNSHALLSASLNSNGQLTISAADSADGVSIATNSGTTNFSSYFGVSSTSAASTIRVNSALANSPSTLPTSELTEDTTSSTWEVGSGDGTTIKNLASAMKSSTTFADTAGLGTRTTTFAGYATNIISNVATTYTSASSTATTASSTLTQLSESFSNESGVNTDSETAKLTQLQNLYAASAQVITAVKAMYSSLLTAVQS